MIHQDKPFFSIAIAAYKRTDLLKESVNSCLSQSFKNLELLIGNDDPTVELTPQMFGGDPRIRIINRPKNLGALKNMNTLLQESRGLYFSWLSDDDLFMPEFLSSAYQAISQQKEVKAVYSSFIAGLNPPEQGTVTVRTIRYLSGREFLKLYLNKEKNIQCFYGVFEAEFIRGSGGIQPLGYSWEAPCADMLFPLQAAQAGVVAFVDSPLVFFRLHQNSISTVSVEHEAYKSSQLAFLEIAWPILSSNDLKEDSTRNLYLLMKWFAADYFEVMRRSGARQWWEMIGYWNSMKRYMAHLQRYSWGYRLYLFNRVCWMLKHLLVGVFRRQSI